MVSPVRKTQIKTFIVAAIIIAILLILYFYKRHAIYKSIVKPKPPVAVVEFIKVKVKKWAPLVFGIGTVHSNKGVALKSQVEGVLVEKKVKPGSFVKKGDLLYVIFPKVQQASLEAAEAELISSKSNYQRQKEIYDNLGEKAISKQALADAFAKFKTNSSVVNKMKATLSLNKVFSPINGKLGTILLNVGSYLPVGKTITHVMPISSANKEVYFAVPAEQAVMLKVGNKVNYTYIQADGKVKKSYGNVTSINTVADVSTRMQMVHSSFSDDFVPGRYVEVSVETENPKAVMVLPDMSVLGGPYGTYVYQVINGKAEKKSVSLGLRRDGMVQIKSGLMPGDDVVLNGQTKILFPGIKVTDKGSLKTQNINFK